MQNLQVIAQQSLEAVASDLMYGVAEIVAIAGDASLITIGYRSTERWPDELASGTAADMMVTVQIENSDDGSRILLMDVS